MSEPREEEVPLCPECNEELWYDEEEDCWVCDNCGIEFYNEEDWEEDSEEGPDED